MTNYLVKQLEIDSMFSCISTYSVWENMFSGRLFSMDMNRDKQFIVSTSLPDHDKL